MVPRAVPLRPILVVDDEPDAVASLTRSLRAGGLTHVVGCQDSREVMQRVRVEEPEVVLLDLGVPPVTGQGILEQLHESCP